MNRVASALAFKASASARAFAFMASASACALAFMASASFSCDLTVSFALSALPSESDNAAERVSAVIFPALNSSFR